MLRSTPGMVPAVHCEGASIVSVDQTLGRVSHYTCKVTLVPALVCGTKGFYVL
jgi:hypothetical protein